MGDDFTQYRISQDQIDRFNDAVARLAIVDKSLVALDAKIERHMAGLESKIEKLADAVALQNKQVNSDLAELRVDVLALKSENRFWRWGVGIALFISIAAVFLVLWRT